MKYCLKIKWGIVEWVSLCPICICTDPRSLIPVTEDTKTERVSHHLSRLMKMLHLIWTQVLFKTSMGTTTTTSTKELKTSMFTHPVRQPSLKGLRAPQMFTLSSQPMHRPSISEPSKSRTKLEPAPIKACILNVITSLTTRMWKNPRAAPNSRTLNMKLVETTRQKIVLDMYHKDMFTFICQGELLQKIRSISGFWFHNPIRLCWKWKKQSALNKEIQIVAF